MISGATPPEGTATIVGIFLVRNEDVFFERAVRSVLDFCDRILIADNRSRDRTWSIATRLAREDGRIECHRIRRTGDSHTLVQRYTGTRTWLFGVDGDEIYDAGGLARFRRDLLAGTYNSWWTIFGNVLNCVALDSDRREARGYLAPPCRSMTKLYNFAAITGWDGPCVERMLGGTPHFRPGFDGSLRLNLHEQWSWEDSSFRCLHTCFLRRSSRDPAVGARRNPVELHARGLLERVGLGFLRRPPPGVRASWKDEKYMRGNLVTKDVGAFLP
jgi:glycosyltransferase involved in cell wall biosynthesis